LPSQISAFCVVHNMTNYIHTRTFNLSE
jgi:hypothetical protein